MKFTHRLISIIMILGIVGCNTAQATPSVPLQATRTVLLPATATATEPLEPSPGPILTPIPTPAGSSSGYHLAAQTADQADENITRMEQTIWGLENVPPPANMPGYRGPNYVPFYKAAWYVAWNALARFPNDPRADKWHWKMAYYMALAGDSDEAARVYMDQITSALNSGRIDAGNLANWFQSGNLEKTIYTPDFTLDQQPVVLPKTQGGYLITIGKPNSMNSPGGMCLLVIKNAGKYVVYPVYNGFSGGYYDVLLRHPTTCSLKDVTDDGLDEIIVDQYDGMHYGTTTIRVYSLISLPPKIMPFTASKDEDLRIWNGGIADYPKIANKTQLLTNASVGITSCDNYYIRSYAWSGKWFDLRNQSFHFDTNDHSAYCADMALSNLYELSTIGAAGFLDQAVQAYRPQAGALGDMYNELIVRKAGYYAVSGETETARWTLNEFIQSPSMKDSIWIEPAQKFLAIYQQPADIYRACSALTACAPYRGKGNDLGASSLACEQMAACDTNAALSWVIRMAYAADPLAGLPARLKETGVDIKAEGWFDFDQDGQDELWFTLLDPKTKDFDLWIVAGSPQGNVVFEVGWYKPDVAQPVFQVRQIAAHPFYINIGKYRDFELLRDKRSGWPMLNWLDIPDSTQPTDAESQAVESDLAKFIQARTNLYSGNDPNSVYRQMMEIDKKYARCPLEIEKPDSSTVYHYDCDAFYFTLAFAAELAGKDDEAVKRYYGVWSVYPDSPFALLAREKLYK